MKKNRVGPEFLQNTTYRFLNLGISYLGGAIFTVIIARLLEPELFGVYTLSLSFALILMTLGDLGISEAVLRYVSRYYNSPSKAKAYIYYLFKIKIIVLLFLSLLLAVFSKEVASLYNKPELTIPLLFASLYILFYSLMQELSNLFYAFKDLKAYAFKEIIFQVTRILFIFILFIIPENLISSSPLIFAVIASILGSIFSILILTKRYKKLFNSKKSKIDLRELLNYIKFLSLGSLSVLFLVYTDVLLLGYFASSETVGFYKAASSLALFLSSAFIFTTIIYPFFTQIKDLKRLNNLVNITLKYILMISIPLTFGTIITARYFVRAIFGYSYLDSSYILYVLAFLIFLLPVGELFKVFLNSKGKSEKTAKIILFSSILNIILNLFFIFYFIDRSVLYASMGVALSTVIARLIILLNLIIISKKEFGIKIDSSIFLKPLIASSLMSVFLYGFTRIIYGEATLFLISFEILAGIVIYFLSLYIIKGISKKDFIYIKDLVQDTINARKK